MIYLHYPEMEDLDIRVSSFTSHWPSNRAQAPLLLAQAGFFYSGESDNTTCFYCGGEVCCWDPSDDPWTEHARWYPRCGFLLSQRGGEFVRINSEIPAPPTRVSSTADVETLRKERQCKVCFDADSTISFHPCGHLSSCRDCAARLCICPICRTVIVRKQLIFFA